MFELCINFMNSTIILLFCVQLRRQARQRREYIYRKSIEDREKTIAEKRQKIKSALDGKVHFNIQFVIS